jgi:methyltransferase (TIGR00027 family)
MEEGKPSRTAVVAAIFRTAHLLLDGEPRILSDDLAFGFSGLSDLKEVHSFVQSFEARTTEVLGPEVARKIVVGYRGLAIGRARYTEDELEKAIGRGVSQYVILGAGLDSFPYRRRDVLSSLTIYEVDYPASQEWKRKRLQELGVSIPNNVVFVPLDLQRRTLSEALRSSGYRPNLPAFFSLLGVTQYISEASLFEILREVVSAAPGTRIVFEYALGESFLTEQNRRAIAVSKGNSAAVGEPWLSQYDPVDLAKRVRQIGFTEVVDFGPAEAEAAYFRERTDQLAGTGHVGGFGIAHLMKAVR